MSIDETELKRNVTDRETWLRLVFMIVFGAAFHIAGGLSLIVALMQFLGKLFSGKVFDGLRDFGEGLGNYMQQVVHYMTYTSDEKPFPFSTWPGKKQDQD